jgi:hypothetical protein
VDSCVDISLGVDALLKIIDTDGQEMGQAYLNLNQFLDSDKIDHPQHIQVVFIYSFLLFTLGLLGSNFFWWTISGYTHWNLFFEVSS